MYKKCVQIYPQQAAAVLGWSWAAVAPRFQFCSTDNNTGRSFLLVSLVFLEVGSVGNHWLGHSPHSFFRLELLLVSNNASNYLWMSQKLFYKIPVSLH